MNWLNECLYVMDVEGFAARRVEFSMFALDAAAPGGEPLRLYSRLHGEDIDPTRHITREIVRGIRAEDPIARQVLGVSSGLGISAEHVAAARFSIESGAARRFPPALMA